MFLFTRARGVPVIVPFRNIAMIEKDYHSEKARLYFSYLPKTKAEINNIVLDETIEQVQAKLNPYNIQPFKVDVSFDQPVDYKDTTGLEIRGG